MTNKIKEKCNLVRLTVSDVNRVLTDSSVFYSKSNEEFKKFNTQDGMGVTLLKQNRINTIFITKENSKFFSSAKNFKPKYLLELKIKKKIKRNM